MLKECESVHNALLIFYRFRWVVCQLDTLRTCLKRSALLKALHRLPKTLDETYDRILLRIPEDYHHDAQIVFSLLAFSPRPISLGEAAEAVAIDLEQKSFDPRDRLPDSCSILKICSSLVTLSPFEPKKNTWETSKFAMDDESKELRFAHYSVKEYLLSKRISSQTFQIHNDNAHVVISKLCLIYLLSFHEIIQEQCCTGSGRSRPRPTLAHPTRPRPSPVLARSGGSGYEFTRPGRSRAGLMEDL